MKNFLVLFLLLVTFSIVACDGEDGVNGITGPSGINGEDGSDGEDWSEGMEGKVIVFDDKGNGHICDEGEIWDNGQDICIEQASPMVCPGDKVWRDPVDDNGFGCWDPV